MKNTRVPYDANFYRLSAIMYSDKYEKLTSKILIYFQSLNCPIPRERFKTVREYHAWIDKYKAKISNKYDAPTPASLLESILVNFGLDPKNESYSLRLWWKFFFDIDQGPVIGVNTPKVKWDEGELWLKLPDWTRKEDYESWWNIIEEELVKFAFRRKKDKIKPTFQRDFLVYQLYLKAKSDPDNLGSIVDKMSKYPEYDDLSKQFASGNFDDNIRSISSKFNKLLKNVNIL